MNKNSNHKLIFERSFNSEKPDIGTSELVQAGDHITFLKDDAFMTREVEAVNGLIITIKPLPNEKKFMFERKHITQIVRPKKVKQ